MGLERVFEAPWTLRDLRSQPLGLFLEEFCDWLLERGFTRCTVRKHLGRLLHLNRWLSERDWHWPGSLSRNEVEGFLRTYSSRCCNRGPLAAHLKAVGCSITRFVEFLTYRGLFDPQSVLPVYHSLLNGYLAWMREHQHAAQGTLGLRQRGVSRFLASLGDDATAEGLARLDAQRVESFFIEYAEDRARASRRSMQAALRTFLRFCFHEGYILQRLDHAVPTLRTYKLAQVPRGLTEAQAQAVLESVDRTTDVGRRDYAILTLLHTYGVRGGQVRALRIEDICWSRDQILFKATKGGKDSLLPLTAEVGESLLDYLRNGRPQCAFHEVFLTSRAPYHPFRKSSLLTETVRRHICALDMQVPCKGSHTFRHYAEFRIMPSRLPVAA